MNSFQGMLLSEKNKVQKYISVYPHTPKKKEGNKNIHICALIERNTEIKTIS